MDKQQIGLAVQHERRKRSFVLVVCYSIYRDQPCKWPESGKFLRFVPDAPFCTDRRRAVRPRPAAHRWLDEARQAASNQLPGRLPAASDDTQAEARKQQGANLVHKTTSACASQHQHPHSTAHSPARRFHSADRTRDACRQRLSTYSCTYSLVSTHPPPTRAAGITCGTC